MTRPRLPLVAFALRAVVAGGIVAGCGNAWAVDAAPGKALAEGCAGCHGENGVSQTEATPSLAGEPDLYIQWQLVFFRGGNRKSEVMGPIAEALNNDEIRNLGAYYASLPPPKGEPAPPADAEAQVGAKLAAGHHCGSCHGDDFVGSGPAARLAGQREDVLIKALRDYKSGARVAPGVASMADVVYDLSDEQMQALVHYMSTLR
jgi:cytochrome c553